MIYLLYLLNLLHVKTKLRYCKCGNGKLQLFRLIDSQEPNVRPNFQVGSGKPNADLILPEPRPRSAASIFASL